MIAPQFGNKFSKAPKSRPKLKVRKGPVFTEVKEVKAHSVVLPEDMTPEERERVARLVEQYKNQKAVEGVLLMDIIDEVDNGVLDEEHLMLAVRKHSIDSRFELFVAALQQQMRGGTRLPKRVFGELICNGYMSRPVASIGSRAFFSVEEFMEECKNVDELERVHVAILHKILSNSGKDVLPLFQELETVRKLPRSLLSEMQSLTRLEQVSSKKEVMALLKVGKFDPQAASKAPKTAPGRKTNVGGAGHKKGPSGGGTRQQTSNPKKLAKRERKLAQHKRHKRGK